MTVFDEGTLKSDMERAQRMVDELLSPMLNNIESSEGEPVVTAHTSIYKQLAVCLDPLLSIVLELSFTECKTRYVHNTHSG